MYAIIETGGKQYKVASGDVIKVEKLDVEAGTDYTFYNVLCIIDGDQVKVGAPNVSGASVLATVDGNFKSKKVIVYKYKSKKGFRKKNGHRQPYTQLKIKSINA